MAYHSLIRSNILLFHSCFYFLRGMLEDKLRFQIHWSFVHPHHHGFKMTTNMRLIFLPHDHITTGNVNFISQGQHDTLWGESIIWTSWRLWLRIRRGKLFLWNTMSFTSFSPPKFFLIFVLTTLFTGTFSLFVVSTIQNIHHLGKVGIRYLFPMWFFSGANYSWHTVFKLSPIFAYITLANPLLYAMEGIHAAVLGQAGYLNYWLCVLMLIMFTIVFGFLGIWKLKKRLDFV